MNGISVSVYSELNETQFCLGISVVDLEVKVTQMAEERSQEDKQTNVGKDTSTTVDGANMGQGNMKKESVGQEVQNRRQHEERKTKDEGNNNQAQSSSILLKSVPDAIKKSPDGHMEKQQSQNGTHL